MRLKLYNKGWFGIKDGLTVKVVGLFPQERTFNGGLAYYSILVTPGKAARKWGQISNARATALARPIASALIEGSAQRYRVTGSVLGYRLAGK
jgi:hypothetical protein